jgi:hypothetical protein
MCVILFITYTNPDLSYIVFVLFLCNCWFKLCFAYHQGYRCLLVEDVVKVLKSCKVFTFLGVVFCLLLKCPYGGFSFIF